MNLNEIENHLLDNNKLTPKEIDGIKFIMTALSEYFPSFDVYTGVLAGNIKVIIFGKNNGPGKRTPAFAIYKRKPLHFGLRFDNKELRKTLEHQHSKKFPLVQSLEDKYEILKFIDEMSSVSEIRTRMTNSKPKDIKNDINSTHNTTDDIFTITKTRIGQSKFKKRLLKHFDYKCAITDCNIESLLEAAHIEPHSTGVNYNISNGILMRTDIHKLFDSRLIKIAPNGTLTLSDTVKKDKYYFNLLENKTLRFPKVSEDLLLEFKRALKNRSEATDFN